MGWGRSRITRPLLSSVNSEMRALGDDVSHRIDALGTDGWWDGGMRPAALTKRVTPGASGLEGMEVRSGVDANGVPWFFAQQKNPKRQ